VESLISSFDEPTTTSPQVQAFRGTEQDEGETGARLASPKLPREDLNLMARGIHLSGHPGLGLLLVAIFRRLSGGYLERVPQSIQNDGIAATLALKLRSFGTV
jgi:hypothetical protein